MTRSRVNADNSQSNTRSFAGTAEPSTFVDGSIWVDTDGVAASIQRLRWKKTPAAGTTAFTGLNDDGNFSLVYTPNYEEVFLNGVLLVRGVDYAATSGDSITFVEATVAGDLVEVFCTPNLAVTDVYTTSQADNKYLPKSLVDAKGDLYVGTADNTTVRLPIGGNDQVLVADSAAASGVAWKGYASQQAAGKNVVVNGAMDYNQRSAGAITTGYICDRWYVITFAGTGTWQRLAIDPSSFSGQVANSAIRITSSSSSNDFCIGQNIEDATTFAGQTVTLSLWARTSSVSANFDLAMISQNFGSGGSATVSTFFDTSGKTFNASWTKLSFTLTLPSIAGKTVGTSSKLELRFDPLGTVANGAWVEVTQVQLELGSTATSFTRAGGTIGGELRECQRYYYRQSSGALYSIFGTAVNPTSTQGNGWLSFPVTMRVAPTSVDTANLGIREYGGTVRALSSIILDTNFNHPNGAFIYGTITGGVAGVPAQLIANNSSGAYIGFSAEI